MRRAALVALAATLSLLLPDRAPAAVSTRHVHSDALRDDFVVSCNPGPIGSDYAAEAESGVPLTDPYAVARGADKGLIHLMDQGGRRTMSYVVPHGLIRALVRVKRDTTLPDWTDLVFTDSGLTVVSTSTANAGIFTDSDVYELKFGRDHRLDMGLLQQNRDALQMTMLGLSACGPAIRR